MTTFKKKDLKKYKGKSDIEELVDDDGTIIGGNKEHDMNISNDSEIYVPDQQTGDEFAAQALQPNRYYYGIDGTPYSHGEHGGFYESEEDLAEAKMKDMVERVINGRNNDMEMVNKRISPDVNRNHISDLEEIGNPLIIKSTQELVNNMDIVDDEGIAIILNYIVSNVDTSKLPQDYKTIIKRKL